MTVIRYHSLAVSREALPQDLVVTGWTDDGKLWACSTDAWRCMGCSFIPNRFSATMDMHS